MSDPLIVDIYAGDLNGKPDVASLVKAGSPWIGLIIKCSEGLRYAGGTWFNTYWRQAKELAGDRYGQDWFRGTYHYLRILEDPTAQARLYLDTIDKAGGWGVGDFWPIVDVENGNNPANASAQQIIDCVSTFAQRINTWTGRSPILYGGSYLADKGITNHMGCSFLWIARYASTLPPVAYTRIGWSLDKLFAWQYCGDGESYLPHYPNRCPMGATDISAVTIAGGGANAVPFIKSHLFAENPNG